MKRAPDAPTRISLITQWIERKTAITSASAALTGSDPLACAALERFCMALGSFAGDLALVQGAKAVVIGGGLGLRLGSKLRSAGFAERFVAKGRFSQHLAQIPVWLMSHPQAGLYGAAAAFAQEHAQS